METSRGFPFLSHLNAPCITDNFAVHIELAKRRKPWTQPWAQHADPNRHQHKGQLTDEKILVRKERVVSSQQSETMRPSFHQASGMATDRLTPYAAGSATNVIAVQRIHSCHMANTFGPAVRESGQIVREMWAPKRSKITQHNVRYVEFRIFGPSFGFFWVPDGSTTWLSV